MASNRQPTPKEVVMGIMTFIGKETKQVPGRSGVSHERTVIKYRCPKPGCPNPEVSFLEKTGFRNPYQHLRSCYARGRSSEQQDEAVKVLYAEALELHRKRGGTIRSHFEMNALSDYDKTIHAYIRWIVMRSSPISEVVDPEFRRISKYTQQVSKDTIVEVIFKLVELVKTMISG